MKKAILVVVLFSFFAISIKAQCYREVVYLKNGSIIKGVVVEQIPSLSLKIKTSDGNLFTYSINEVERVEKEQITDESIDRKAKHRQQNTLRGRTTKQKTRGYRGFVDFGYIESNSGSSSIEANTTHGYQFNSFIFLGGGVGIDYGIDDDMVSMPIYSDFKVNFCRLKNTPFFDLKYGFIVSDKPGLYIAPALGVRFSLQNKKAVDIRVGYRFREKVSDENDYNLYQNSKTISSGFSVKVGFEF